MSSEHDGTRPFTATVVVGGCPLTAEELRVLARTLPELSRVRTARHEGGLFLQARLDDVDGAAAVRRLRRAVPRLLTGFPGVVVAAGPGPAPRSRTPWWRPVVSPVPAPRAAGG